jgi:hypothetical protein
MFKISVFSNSQIEVDLKNGKKSKSHFLKKATVKSLIRIIPLSAKSNLQMKNRSGNYRWPLLFLRQQQLNAQTQ